MVKVKIIKQSPDRPNVYLDVKKRLSSAGGDYTAEDSVYAVADDLLLELQEKTTNFDKTILYVPLKWCGLIHERAMTIYGVGTYVAQYHAPQSTKMKAHILSDMQRENSVVRLLLATEACGMGIDIPDVRKIIHITPPSNLETYVQEIGRCGRDGAASVSVLYYNNSDIGENKVHLQQEMRQYLRNIECRRRYIMEYFGFTVCPDPIFPCCNNCESNGSSAVEQPLQRSKTHVFPHHKKELVKSLLLKYFNEENKVNGQFLSPLRTGLSEQLVNNLSSKSVYDDIDVLKKDFPALKEHYLETISKIIRTVKAYEI